MSDPVPSSEPSAPGGGASKMASSPARASGNGPPSRGAGSRRRLVRWSRLLAVLLLVILAMRIFGVIESRAFYFPSRAEFATPRGFEDVWIDAPGGVRLHGWFMPAVDARGSIDAGEKRPAILHCHGNAGKIESHADFSRFLTQRGFHVLIFDYRGYGRSSPASNLLRHELGSDALAAYDYLAKRSDVDPSRIGVYGVSLGATFALHVAQKRERVAAACTVSAFSAWSTIASDHLPILGGLLIPGGLDPAKLVASLRARPEFGEPKQPARPLLILHGDADEIIPVRHAHAIERAARKAGVPLELVIVPNADHNGIMEHQRSRDAVGGFFTRTLTTQRP